MTRDHRLTQRLASAAAMLSLAAAACLCIDPTAPAFEGIFEQITPAAGDNPLALTVGSFDEINNEERNLPSPNSAQIWNFDPGDAQAIVIRLESNQFDPYLTLYDPDGTLMDADDDGAGNLNSLIVTDELDLPGEYGIEVSAYSGAGRYRLNVVPLPVSLDFITDGSVPTFVLEAEPLDAAIPPAVDGYTAEGHLALIDGQAQQTLTLSVQPSLSLDPWIELYTDEGERIAFVNDGSNGDDERLELTLPETGRYILYLRFFGGGTYSLNTSPAQ
ncbi:MAG: hypothetical protein GYB68_08920 [Chloroflexi bacterium]|nr:hypothetical protein [Chloroflexota bacterium]